MKMIIRQIMALVTLCWALVSCSDDTVNREYGEGMGYLRLQLGKVDVDLSSTTRAEASSLPDSLIPTTADFMIDIKQGSTSVDDFPKKYSELSEGGVELMAGAYTVTAYYGENEPIQNTPYFVGTSTVEIYPGQSTPTTINAVLANAMLVPAVSESLQKHYSAWTLTVKSGDVSMTLAENDKSDGYLFAKAEQPVNAVFEGTNALGNPTSQEWTVISSAEAQTKYVIQCDPDLSISFGLKAVVEHTQDNLGYLNGTKVTLSFNNLSNIPISLITDWKATLVNATGVEVRSYSTTDFTNTEMDVVDNWIYLPQGDYTLKYSYTLDGEKVSEEETGAATITVPQPTFTAEVSAQTSYSVYTSQGAAVANEKDGSGIFDIATTTTISPDILEKYANLLSISYSLNSGESTTPESPIFQNLQWGKHTLTASVSFDGSNVTASMDCEVTGIPYSFNFYNNESALNNSNWTKVNVDYTISKCTIQYDGSNGYLISPNFHIPTPLSVDYSIQAQYYRAWFINVSSKSIDLQVGVTSTNSSVATNYITHTCKGDNNTGKSYGTYTGTLDLSSDFSYISFYHNNANVSGQIDYLCLYEFTLQYK
jgi:hypothetical protein